MKIKKPVLIVGSGRSGTTLLYNLMAMHPDVCWFSNLTDKAPSNPWLSIFHRAMDLPWFGDVLKRQYLERSWKSIRPSEAGNIYHSHCGLVDAQYMTEKDLTPEIVGKFNHVIESHLRFTGKPRFLGKQTTNNQHIRLINALFPDAYYIHIIRDGRAVANSLNRVKWWPHIDLWWLGHKPADWASTGKEPIELCARHWQRDVEEIFNNKHLFADRYMEVRYSDLIADLPSTMKTILHFCELRHDAKFFELLPESLTNMNYKWQTQLNETQKQVLAHSIGDFLAQLGYEN